MSPTNTGPKKETRRHEDAGRYQGPPDVLEERQLQKRGGAVFGTITSTVSRPHHSRGVYTFW